MFIVHRRDRERMARLERQIAELRGDADRILRSVTPIAPAMEGLEQRVSSRSTAGGPTAEAYEGLRKSVILAREERMAHMVDLARIDALLSRGAAVEELVPVVREMLGRAGVHRVEDVEDPALFDVFDGSEVGGGLLVLEPAHVHLESGAVVRLGRAGPAPTTSGRAEESSASKDLKDRTAMEESP